MTDFALPKPPLPFLTELALAASASSARMPGSVMPSIPAPPIRSSSRRVTPPQSITLLPGMDNIASSPVRLRLRETQTLWRDSPDFGTSPFLTFDTFSHHLYQLIYHAISSRCNYRML